MHAALRPLYAAAAQLARLGAALAPQESTGKLARTLAARRGIRQRYIQWGAQHRDPARALLWMHAPSVGEGLQARPVLQHLRAAHPEWQLAYTFFSPSAEAFARSLDVDGRDYLPFDDARDAAVALDAWRPNALVFSKLDVWPVLVREAARRRIPLGMISATLAPDSTRRGAGSRALLGDAYAALDLVGAIDAEDAERLVSIGVRADRIRVTGDTRYDQVWERAQRADRASALLAPLASERPTLVAGSTWPADEEQLLPAFMALRRAVPEARMIIAPHEPTAAHLDPIERWARDGQVPLARLGTPQASSADVVLVDRVGVLGDLYALADAAFVGGGFHAAGLHSVLEPAAFGAPVVFGPRFTGSRDARLLVSRGGSVSAPDAAAIEATLVAWLAHHDQGRAAGSAARALVTEGLGAAARSARLVEDLMARRVTSVANAGFAAS
ncbi:MAG TPA: glycosyltransferase N-terminal domain-containing protein [Gemmatimonadaceae bacterium]|nr:glycosyltransferase N-terminal domain-containing protein [Gemmatimonadaceae bacterium]